MLQMEDELDDDGQSGAFKVINVGRISKPNETPKIDSLSSNQQYE